jgi:phosphocarrier protein HPr
VPEVTVPIRNRVGLHARPAAVLVQEANKYRSDIKIRLGKKLANAKSILDVLTLGAENGSVITLSTEGDDAAEALTAIQQLVEAGFGEVE